jgi:large subunit ribosomal protein L10
MNREQKATAIAEIADQIRESDAIFAIDYRGISVPQAAELRGRLRDADATFRVVKNTLTRRAADDAGVDALKPYLLGPTALTFVRGDVAVTAKVLADLQKDWELLDFKGGLMGEDSLDPDQLKAIAKLPSRQGLYGQLVGLVASPISGLARSLNGLTSGLAIALGGVLEKKQSGEIPAAADPEVEQPVEVAADEPQAEAPGDEPVAETPVAEPETAEAPEAEASPEETETETEQADASAAADETTTEANEE